MASRGRLPTNSTSISLHERFSRLKSAAGGQKLAGNVQARRQATALLQKASSKNHRLAQQMERRTATSATLAALKLKKKSIKQRLGATQPTFNTGARLRGALTQKQRKLATAGRGGTTVARLGNSNNRAALQNVKSPKPTVSRGGKRGRGNKSQPGAITPKRTAPVTTPTRTGGGRQRGRGRGRGAQNKAVANTERKAANSPGKRGRGGRGGQQGGGKVQRNQQSTPRGKGQPSPQRGRGGRGRGGRGGRGGQTKPKLSKEELDKEMDQYMSKTRTASQDLDSYMTSGLPGDVDMN